MHPLRFLWERIERARRAAKSKSDLLGLVEAPIKRRFLLARIDETAAVPASKELTSGIKHRCAAQAVGAHEPRTLPTVAASRPGDRHLLEDRLLL